MNSSIRGGLNLLVLHDRYLLENDASERSITHRLGLYYQAIFAEWDVDCEFNINLGGPKIIAIEPREFLRLMAGTLEESYGRQVKFNALENEHVSIEDVQSLIRQLENPTLEVNQEFDVLLHVLKLRDRNNHEVTVRKPVYPDIIVHKRGTENNLIVIEAKKTTSKIRGARLYDLIKLKCLADTPFNYKYTYFVDLPVKSNYKRHKNFNFVRGIHGITEVTSNSL